MGVAGNDRAEWKSIVRNVIAHLVERALQDEGEIEKAAPAVCDCDCLSDRRKRVLRSLLCSAMVQVETTREVLPCEAVLPCSVQACGSTLWLPVVCPDE